MTCHNPTSFIDAQNGSIALVGHPNVGKSVIFQRLTGKHATVSNYPGTTVEVTRGAVRRWPDLFLVDTPGIITLPAHSDDEEVTERVLLNEPLRAIIQVGDAKNLRRTLLLSVQLAELGIPIVLALNMMDEARQRGIVFDPERLSDSLGFSVIPTTAVRGQGIDELHQALEAAIPSNFHLAYPREIETKLDETTQYIESHLTSPSPVSVRGLALLWISHDPVCENWLRQHLEVSTFTGLIDLREQFEKPSGEALGQHVQATRLAWVDRLIPTILIVPGNQKNNFAITLGRQTTHPVWGLIILAVVLFGLYEFVGVFGAGKLVGLLEGKLFTEIINPWITSQVTQLIPIPIIQEFLVGPYGLWTMGVTYALALILPIVTTFFLAFGVMEDSGYLPRLAALSNQVFARLGLNGKAVLPMVLGLGCVTMATLTTRIMESKRERLLVTLLLALAVPCSA
jgi:ferrous iron transport protein B